MPSSNPPAGRVQKFALLLKTILDKPGLNQVMLARITKLNRSEVCRLIQEGIAAGLIQKKSGYYHGPFLEKHFKAYLMSSV